MPGAGGQEASLFAEEVFHFYIQYCQDRGCDIEIVEETKQALNKSSKSIASSGLTKVCFKKVNIPHNFKTVHFRELLRSCQTTHPTKCLGC